MIQGLKPTVVEVVKVKVEPPGCQLGCSSNKSYKDRKWLPRGQVTQWDAVSSAKDNIITSRAAGHSTSSGS